MLRAPEAIDCWTASQSSVFSTIGLLSKSVMLTIWDLSTGCVSGKWHMNAMCWYNSSVDGNPTAEYMHPFIGQKYFAVGELKKPFISMLGDGEGDPVERGGVEVVLIDGLPG